MSRLPRRDALKAGAWSLAVPRAGSQSASSLRLPVAVLGSQGAAKRYLACQAFQVVEICEDPAAVPVEAQAAVVATPVPVRGTHALAMLRARRHVLIEPPIAATYEDFDRVMGEANARDLRVGAVYPLRFAPHAIRAREIVSRNQLGRVTAIRAAAVQEAADRRGHLGPATDLIDLVRWMLADAAGSVAALRDLDADPAISPSTLHLLVPFGGAALAYTAVPAPDPDLPGGWTLTLTGQRGRLKLTGDGRLYLAGDTWAEQRVETASSPPLERLTADFAQACRQGREPEVNGVDGMAGVGLLLGAVASAHSGRAAPLVHPGYHWETDHAYVRSQRRGK